MTDSILVAHDLSKRYGGVQALRSVGFELRRQEIHGLCGENGAGKSTIVKILGGFVKPDTGTVTVDGVSIALGERVDPRLISIVHQELSIVPHLSVSENVMLGAPEVGAIYLRSRFDAIVRKHLDAVGLSHIDPSKPASTLSLAERQLVEIARGVARGAKVLLLDEPTATLSDAEISRVFSVLRTLRDAGTSLVIISHRLDEIFALTDRVTVFRSGQHVWTRRTDELTNDELVRAMIGRDLVRGDHATSRVPRDSGTLRIRTRNHALAARFKAFDLAFAPGEIVAVVGQLGSGADAFIETLAGLHPAYTGHIELDGKAVLLHSIEAAHAEGIAYVPEDRAGKGVFLDAPIGINLTSHILPQVSTRGWISSPVEHDRASSLAGEFQIDPSRLPHDVSTLSGGNQQKVAIAKAVSTKPRLLLLNEPTRGVDIGARAEIYTRIRKLTEGGMTVIFYSTDLEEIMEVAERIVTVYRGSIVRFWERETATNDDILHDILHGSGILEAV
ncbi:sugar ABC transporter ATP-binding protein [Paraburkholderia sabiae]|uniref:Autoinducer 2 import ATP-binding protein LsrA n=1 Tax=Paraburkholderia sabiae TaxID=273251 RepID=A0ABU9QK97_9BURK|nr:sugar ABC transporter ATP-binding protein [Paraburkholderia sabiae]WJZ76482.1 sugar ABC transporter ATP-binding protein [Paraburkholderia sabiae]CAD6560192.1 Arabinose import ATP-binding protein AraG [Paraburkholderia sabiae]